MRWTGGLVVGRVSGSANARCPPQVADELVAAPPVDPADGRSVRERRLLVTTGLTDVPGVWVAGDIADVTAQVTASAAHGMAAATAINVDLRVRGRP